MKNIFLLFLFLQTSLHGATFSAKTEIVNPTIAINQRLIIDLKLQYPSNTKPDYNQLTTNLLSIDSFSQPPFQLIKRQIIDKQEQGDQVSETVRYTLDPHLVGPHYLSFFAIPFLGEEPQSLISDVLKVEVTAAPPPTQTVHVAPLMDSSKAYPLQINWKNQKRWVNPSKEALAKNQWQYWNTRQFPWKSLVTFLAVTILLYIAWSQRFYFKRKETIADVRGMTLKKIKQLQKETLSNKEYYQKLSFYLRNYLEKRYAYPFTSSTSKELSHFFEKEESISKENEEKMSQFFVELETLRFSPDAPSKDLVDEAVEIIWKT